MFNYVCFIHIKVAKTEKPLFYGKIAADESKL